jgi:hypothetical protein
MKLFLNSIFIVLGLLLMGNNSFGQDSTAKAKNAKLAKNNLKTKKANSTKKETTTNTKNKPDITVAQAKAKVNGPLQIAYKSTPGYRLQVITTTSRDSAIAMKSKMYAMYPNQPCYISNKPPYYSVHQGNYLNLNLAKKAKVKLANQLKTMVYIVRADILVKYYPQLEPKTDPFARTVNNRSRVYTYNGKALDLKNGKKGSKKKSNVAKTKKKAAAPVVAAPAAG